MDEQHPAHGVNIDRNEDTPGRAGIVSRAQGRDGIRERGDDGAAVGGAVRALLQVLGGARAAEERKT
eukprot:514589-Prymnesium_polylepis.1